MNDQDETEIDATEAMPATPAADPLALLTALLTTITSARQCERRVRELRRETASAEKAKLELAGRQTEIAAARATFDQYKAAELAKIQVQADAAQARMDAAEAKEDSFAERERRIHELEQRWKFVDEGEDVRRGFREPENGTALEKARKVYGLSDDAVDTSVPMPDGNDADFSSGLPPDATLARAAQPRSMPARRTRSAEH